jgi:hypothetical protein
LVLVNETGVISLTTIGALCFYMKQELDLLKRAAEEIKQLRSQNQLMTARLDVFDKMMLLFTVSPTFAGQGMGPDIVYDINKQIVKSEAELKEADWNKAKSMNG